MGQNIHQKPLAQSKNTCGCLSIIDQEVCHHNGYEIDFKKREDPLIQQITLYKDKYKADKPGYNVKA